MDNVAAGRDLAFRLVHVDTRGGDFARRPAGDKLAGGMNHAHARLRRRVVRVGDGRYRAHLVSGRVGEG